MKRSSSRTPARRRSLALQQLESRGMLAGNVTVSLTGTTINIVGDAADNSVELDETAGTLNITGLAGTTIIGTSSYSLAQFTRVNMTMNAGDDTVSIQPSILTGKDIAANLGNAAIGDIFTASGVTMKALSVTAGNGGDSVTIDNHVGVSIDLKLAGTIAGAQSIDLDNLDLSGALNVNAGAAADAAISSFDLDASMVDGVVAVITNKAGSTIDVDSLIGSAVTIKAVASTDFNYGTVAANSITGALNVTTGATSSLTVGDAAVAGNVVGGLGTLVAGGDSSIAVTDVEFNNTVIAKTANGTTNSIVFDGIDIAGSLTVNMGNSTNSTLTLFDDDASLDIGGAVAIVVGNASGANTVTIGGDLADLDIGGNTGIVLGIGTNALTIENVTIFNAGSAKPILNVQTRNGDSTVIVTNVLVEAAASITTGNAVTQNVITVDGLTTLQGGLTIRSGIATTAQNDIDVSNSSIGVGFSYDLVISNGLKGQANLGATVDVSNVTTGRNLSITTFTGDDAISIEGSTITGSTTINTDIGFDSVSFGFSVTSSFGKLVTINLGLDDDTLDVGPLVSATGAFLVPTNPQVAWNGNGGVNTITCALFDPFVAPYNQRVVNFTP